MDKIVYPFDPTVNALKYVFDTVRYTDAELNTEYKSYGFITDAEDFVSISRKKDVRDFVYKVLSKPARDFFFLIPLSLNKDYKYVILPYTRTIELVGEISERTYRRGITELIKYSVIDFKDKAKGEYWINHHFFHFGNRIKMFPDTVNIVSIIQTKPNQV